MGKSIQKERIGPYEIFVKEFYAKMTVIHLKKKDIVKSKVRGVEIEFDHEKLATILGILGNNGICEYVKDVWEESKYIKPLEITRRGIGVGEKFYDLEEDARGSQSADEIQRMLHPIRFDEGRGHSGVDPRVPLARRRLYEVSSEFERKRANKFHDELEKAKAENAELLALLHQAQTKPHP
ncbi:hypothetical protein Dimus_020951 [Dionaea muscipula]